MSADSTPRWATGRVVGTRVVADGVRRITIARPPSRRAAPGSHVDVRVRLGDAVDVRSYSVVESSADGGEITISVLRVPHSRGGSVFMHGLDVGDELSLTQPLQSFPLAVGAPAHVLLAGGVGITAVLEMARVLRTLRADYRLVYVGRSRAAMAYAAELAELHGERLQLHVDDEGTPLDVAALVDSVATGGALGTELYMCGPIRLMDAVRCEWARAALPAHGLRFETFGSSGWFDAEAFVVRVPELGVETTVGADVSLLDALTAAGADLMYDCRKGECGLCEVRVEAVDGVLDHRDVFLGERQRARGDRICACVSRVASAGPRTDGSGPPVLSLALS